VSFLVNECKRCFQVVKICGYRGGTQYSQEGDRRFFVSAGRARTIVTLSAAVKHGSIIVQERFSATQVAMLRLDYISCILTIISTLLVGRKLWQGWIIAGANSAIICFIGMRTAQFGFIPANLFCIALYSYNLRSWRK
jgi:hypothetical protein